MAAHRSRVLLAIASALALGAFGIGSASGATPAALNPIITYTGSSTVTSLDDGSESAVELSATVDCTTLPCTLVGTVSADGITLAFTGADAIPIIDGVASAIIPVSGNVCDNTYNGGGPISVVVTAASIVGTAEVAGSDEVDCSDGTTVQYIAARVNLDLHYVSGDTCFLTNDCPTPTPTAVAAEPLSPPPTARAALGASEPGTLSTLPTIAEAATPRNALWAAAGTIVLAILIALPSQLLNTAVESGSDRLASWWRRSRPARPAASRVWLLPVGIAVAALISSFADPEFGLSWGGLRVFLSILASFVVDAVLGWLLVLTLLRRTRPGTPASIRFLPATLVIVAIAVLFTRITGFQPGIIFGLVAGIAVGAALANADRARIVLAGLGWSFVIAVIGWIGFSLLAPVDPTPFVVFLRETLSALAIGGIAALPIALVPLRGLVGHEIYTWNRWVWGSAYAVGLFGFFFVLMPMPFSWESVPLSLWTWVAVYVGYALGAVGLWLAFTQPWKRAEQI